MRHTRTLVITGLMATALIAGCAKQAADTAPAAEPAAASAEAAAAPAAPAAEPAKDAAAATDAAAPAADTAKSADAAGPVTGEGTFVDKDGGTMKAVYRAESVTLTLKDGSTKVLKSAVSGSGSRYADGNIEWWEHQGEGTYAVDGKDVFVGKVKK